MFTIILETIRAKKVALFSFSLAAVLFMLMFVSLFPSIKEQTADFEEFLKAYPEGFTKAFNIESLSFETLENFISVEHISITWPLMAMFFVISFAGASMTREIETGTIELLLAKPISRTKIFVGKYLGSLFSFMLFCFISFMSVVPLAELSNIEYQFDHFVVVMVVGFLFGFAIMSLAFMFSVLFSERNKVYMIMGGMLLAMYLAKIITNFQENLENLQYVSFFHYFDATETMVEGMYNTTSIAVFAGCGIIAFLIGLFVFRKRDVAV